MGFLTDEEVASLQITRMILHVVGTDVEFEPQPEMGRIDHGDFFRARIQDMAADSVYVFDDQSETKAIFDKLATGAVTFEAAGQTLARRFSLGHVGSSRDGALFMFELGTDVPRTSLYCLIKYDYRQAIELYEAEGHNALRQIIQAFIQERRSVQKYCLVRIARGVVERGISAQDRMGKAPDLTEYFARFLDVARTRSDVDLNRDLNEAMRSTLEKCAEHLPPGGPAKALNVAKNHLRTREQIDDSVVREAVFVAAGRPDDEDVRASIEKVTDRELRKKRLSGVTFRPDQSVLRVAARRRIRTAEGVSIEFPGAQEQRAVVKTTHGHSTTITITTSQALVEDGTLPYKPIDHAGYLE